MIYWREFGKIAYETQMKGMLSTEKLSHIKVPEWEELDPDIQKAWIQTAITICEFYGKAITA